MKYIIKQSAYNVLNEKLPDVVMSMSPDRKIKFASYFETHFSPIEFDSVEQAFENLVDRLNEPEKYFFDEWTGKVFRLISDNQIAEQGFKIEASK